MEEDEAISEIRALVESLTCNGPSLDDASLDTAYRLSLSASETLERKCDDILTANAERPVLCINQSDGWGVQLSHRHTVSVDGQRVVREGRVRRETLLERGIVRTTRPCGKVAFGVRIKPPRIMKNGRSAWNVFAAATEFASTLRAAGHQGVAIHIYLMDGCSTNTCAQERLCALHSLYYDEDGPCPKDERWFLKQTEWVIALTCVVHTGHSSVKWGLSSVMDDTISEDSHVAL